MDRLVKSSILLIIIILLSFSGYFFYNRQVFEHIRISKTADPCADFSSRFGATPQGLIDFVNSNKESAQILSGWRYLYGQIQGKRLTPPYPILIKLNEGKIETITCKKPDFSLDEKLDVEFSLPEADFKYIVSNRENLEANESINYLQNLNTKPSSVKMEVIQRIENLE